MSMPSPRCSPGSSWSRWASPSWPGSTRWPAVYQWAKQIARPFTAWFGGRILSVGAIVTLAAVAVAYRSSRRRSRRRSRSRRPVGHRLVGVSLLITCWPFAPPGILRALTAAGVPACWSSCSARCRCRTSGPRRSAPPGCRTSSTTSRCCRRPVRSWAWPTTAPWSPPRGARRCCAGPSPGRRARPGSPVAGLVAPGGAEPGGGSNPGEGADPGVGAGRQPAGAGAAAALSAAGCGTHGRIRSIRSCCGCWPGSRCRSGRRPGSCATSWSSTPASAAGSSTSSTAG